MRSIMCAASLGAHPARGFAATSIIGRRLLKLCEIFIGEQRLSDCGGNWEYCED